MIWASPRELNTNDHANRFTAVTLLGLFCWLRQYSSSPIFRRLGVVALLGNFAVAIAVLPLLPYGWDILKFHRNALSILSGTVPQASTQVTSFAAFQSLVYATFGADPTIMSLVNGFLAVVVVIPVTELARRLYPNLHTTELLMALLLFFPLPFLYLSIPMRDVLNLVIFFTILAALARGHDLRQPWLILLAIPLLGALSLLRPELGFIVEVGILAAIIGLLIKKISIRPKTVLELAFIGGIAGVVSLPVVGPRLPIDSIRYMRTTRAHGGAAYLESVEYTSWVDLLLSAPIRGIYFQFAPFPLHATSAFDLLAGLMLPILIIIAVAAYRSGVHIPTNDVLLIGLVTIYLVGVLGYGVVDSNFGTTVRHRIPFSFLLCVFAASVFARWEQSLRQWIGERPGESSGHDE